MGDIEWKKLREEIESVRFRKLTHKFFQMPDGSEAEFTTLHIKSNNVAIIALTEKSNVILAQQFRPGPEFIMEELPGGDAGVSEDLASAALRELKEETGYTTDRPLIYLGKAYRNAYSNETDNYFLALGCKRVSGQELDKDEFVKVVEVSIDTLIENAKTGKMSDAPAVLMAYEKLMEIKNGAK